MSKMKKKATACVVSAIMAFSMVSVMALTAFADDLAAGLLNVQSSSDPIVYDTVYGVRGGQYALMMKTVTYEEMYKGAKRNYTATISDVTKPGNVATVHTSNAVQDNDALPGEWTDYRLADYQFSDFVKVSDKPTGKVGVKRTDGSDFLPCAYDGIELDGTSFACTTIGESKVSIEFFGTDGANMGSFSFDADGAAYSYISYKGDYVLATASGGSLTNKVSAVAKKSGSTFTRIDGATYLLDVDESGNALILKGDTAVYRASDGTETPIYSSETLATATTPRGHLYGSIVMVENSYFTKAGVQLEAGQRPAYNGAMGEYALFAGSNSTYYAYGPDGDVVYTFTAESAGALKTPYYYQTATSGDSRTIEIHKPDGTLVKSIGPVASDMSLFTLAKANLNGISTVYGYRVGTSMNKSEAGDTYYDLSFNELSGQLTASGDELKLADGKGVYVYISGSNNNVSHSVVDRSGNNITIGGYTLGVASDCDSYSMWNCVKHGNADLWWATDADGHWGAVNSSGEVLVPFEYESYYDAGLKDTDYALVKKDGAWSFLKVASDAGHEDTSVMHRLYNQYSGEHFYTSNDEEFAGLVALGWSDEGTGWTAPEWSNTPVYRMYNAWGGEHHYCMTAEERDFLIDAGWEYEDIGWYSDDAHTVPLYREYNPNEPANNHNYTTSKEEHDYLVSLGWRDEGHAWYGM